MDSVIFQPLQGEPSPPRSGPTRVQPASRSDTSLVNPLGAPPGSVARQVPSPAERNLLRGWRLSLPSGLAVAHAIGTTRIADADLGVGMKQDPLRTPLPGFSKAEGTFGEDRDHFIEWATTRS